MCDAPLVGKSNYFFEGNERFLADCTLVTAKLFALSSFSLSLSATDRLYTVCVQYALKKTNHPPVHFVRGVSPPRL